MKNTPNPKRSILSAVIVTFFGILHAQNNAEISDSIFSEVLNEQRTIKIQLPKDYKPGSKNTYEVIYILDGEWNMQNFSFIHNFAMEDHFVPAVILVAVPNTYIDGQNMRDRDFLPEPMTNNARAGKADDFLQFLEEELIPYIDGKYPTNGVNNLYGHSYGGVFSMYALLKSPHVFHTYYCTDPPLGWQDDFLTRFATEKFSNTSKLDKKLWIAGRDNNKSITDMDVFLQKHAPKKLTWKTAGYPKEKHNSVRLKGIYDGIKFGYE